MIKDLKHLKKFDISQAYSQNFGLQTALAAHANKAHLDNLDAKLKNWQSHLAGWNDLAGEASRPEKLPRIEKYDFVGNPLERVILPLETKTLRRQVVEQGIFDNQSNVELFSKIYLLAQLGESGITCPLACTDGLIRVVSELGTDNLKEKYLPLLLSAEYPLAGAQFVTEQSGGSDVGAIQGIAKRANDGTYRIHAEKWYCSAYDEFFLVAARPEHSPAGSSGIAIFFVPRLIEMRDPYFVNHLSIKRLKNKLGTQSLPTGEVDFNGSIAYPLGNVEQGFENLMSYVLNTSRLHNAANCLGFEQRALAEAINYTSGRIAFGKPLIAFPLIQENLLNHLFSHYAKLGLFLQSVAHVDRHGIKPADKDKSLWQRFLINLMKYRTAVGLTEAVKDCIIAMGANGIVEDFSILPRLLRDSLIVETWEGPHNVLCLQILRDSSRFNFFDHLQEEINSVIDVWPESVLPATRRLYAQAIVKMQESIGNNMENKNWAEMHARRLVDHWALFLEIGQLVKMGMQLNSHNLLLGACHLTYRHLIKDSIDQLHHPIVQHLQKLGQPLLAQKAVEVDLSLF